MNIKERNVYENMMGNEVLKFFICIWQMLDMMKRKNFFDVNFSRGFGLFFRATSKLSVSVGFILYIFDFQSRSTSFLFYNLLIKYLSDIVHSGSIQSVLEDFARVHFVTVHSLQSTPSYFSFMLSMVILCSCPKIDSSSIKKLIKYLAKKVANISNTSVTIRM